MAKGFTVKAKSPVAKQKAPEWDYNLARQLIRGKTIVFCLPGRGVSYNFLKSFVSLSFDLVFDSTTSTSASSFTVREIGKVSEGKDVSTTD